MYYSIYMPSSIKIFRLHEFPIRWIYKKLSYIIIKNIKFLILSLLITVDDYRE